MQLCAGRTKAEPAGTPVKLLAEDLALLQHPSVTTVTWYTGPVPDLKARCLALAAANPWLLGQLWTGADGVRLIVPDEPGSLYSEHEALDLQPSLDYGVLKERLAEHCVPAGKQCVDNGEPLVRVTLLRTEGGFAVCFSMSHVIADGATYYQLFCALGTDAPPALEVERLPDFGPALETHLGAAQAQWKTSGSLISGVLGKLTVRRPFLPRFECRAYYIDSGWVAAEKQQHDPASGVPFVSTNDVVTSWFLNRGAYDYGMMMVNFRGRLAGATAAHAGNYEGDLQLFPDMFATPADVRRPLLNGFTTGRSDVPGVGTNLRSHFACVSSWASFPCALQFPGCTQQLHLPIMHFKGIMDACVIFRPTPTTLAVLLGERWTKDQDPALGERIF